ncbi:MAG: hypothetical protein ABSE48_08930 [Verrucomicrobiota bacterium]
MKKPCLGRLPLVCLLPCFVGFTLAAAADENQSEQEAFDRYFGLKSSNTSSTDWTGHFSIGAVVGLNINANFKENGLFTVNGNNPANGIYNDGYVREDSTGNTGGYTGYWGYDNASQFNAASQTLNFHSTASYQATDSGARDQGGPFPGFDMVYGGNLYQWQSIGIGWDLGFDLLPMKISDNRPLSATVDQTTYSYNTGGIILPGPGYQGTYGGSGSPVLPGTPTTTTPETGLAGTVTGTRSLDMILYAIRLGPTFYWNITKDFSASFGVGPAMGIVSAEYKYDEVITTATSGVHNSGSFSGMDVVFGGDVNATLLYHTADEARPVDLYLTAQYMPLGSADFSQGGRDGRLNLSGAVYISAGVNWPF